MSKEFEITLSTMDHYFVPNEPFVCVLGTSHTYGECEGKSNGILEYDDIWSTVLSKKLGIRVLNFGLAGATNQELLEALKIFSKIEKFKENCVGVIVEGRYGKDSITLDIPAMINYLTMDLDLWRQEYLRQFAITIKDKCLRQVVPTGMFQMKDVENIINQNESEKFDQIFHLSSAFFKSFRITQTEVNSDLNEQVLMLIDGVEVMINDYNKIHLLEDEKHSKFELRLTEIAKIIEYVNFSLSMNNSNMESIVRNQTNQLDNMKEISKNMDIPFYWFSMDNYTTGKSDIGIKEFEEEIDVKKFKYHESFKTDLYDYEIFDCGASYRYLMETGDLPERCDCGHYLEPFHNWVADKVYDEIKGEIHK